MPSVALVGWVKYIEILDIGYVEVCSIEYVPMHSCTYIHGIGSAERVCTTVVHST